MLGRPGLHARPDPLQLTLLLHLFPGQGCKGLIAKVSSAAHLAWWVVDLYALKWSMTSGCSGGLVAAPVSALHMR